MIFVVIIYFLLYLKLPTTDQDGTNSFIDTQTSRMNEFEVSTKASLSGGYNSNNRKKLSVARRLNFAKYLGNVNIKSVFFQLSRKRL